MTAPVAAPVAAAARARGNRLGRLLWRHPWALTAVVAGVLLALPTLGGPVTGGDLAAQQFRAWLVGHHGAVLWDNYWYSGHPLAGYSVLFPPLGSLLGTRVLGALACVWSAAAFSALVNGGPDARPDRAGRIAAIWFALACLGQLVIGQLPFGLGMAAGLTALVLARRDRRLPAFALAGAASLSSPLAGAFLLLVALAWWREAGLRRTAPLGGATLGLASAWVFGEGGYFPFPVESLLTVLLFCVGGLVLVRDLGPSMRWALVLYATSSLTIFAVPNPVGGNAARLGAVAAGPLAALMLGRRGRWLTLGAVAVPLLCWQLWPIGTALSRSVGDPSSGSDYYAGLAGYLRTQDPARGPVEVPALRQHWESWHVPRVFPLARGWERQQDLKDNEVLYDDGLTADQLHTWLRGTGVQLVALAGDVPLDHWAQREAALLRQGQPWLRPVWSDAHWQVWQVTDATGLVSGPATMTRLGVDSFELRADRPGTSLVRLHWSPAWQLVSGSGCLRRSDDGWVEVDARTAGPLRVEARWRLGALVTRSTSTC